MTELLLSSTTTLPWLEEAFRLAKSFHFDGLELMPYRWTTVNRVKRFSEIYQIPVKGVHLPFWWHTKPLWKVIASETEKREWVFATIWWFVFGSGHNNCPAVKLLKEFTGAYCLIHPDTYGQSQYQDFMISRTLFFENERPKLQESAIAYDPWKIKKWLSEFNLFFDGQLMLDPGHIQIAQKTGILPRWQILSVYQDLRPEGLHLSFSDGDRLHDLPTDEEWGQLVQAIKHAPPRYLVVETRPGPGTEKRLRKIRDMIRVDLNL